MSSSTAPVTSILMGPGECDVPLPINRIIRRHRFYQTLAVVVPAAEGKGTTSLHPVVVAPSLLMLALRARDINADTTAIQLLGGAPIGFLRPTDVRRLERPLLAQASVKGITELALSGKVRLGGRLRPVEVTSESLEELAANGKAILRVDGRRVAVVVDRHSPDKVVRVSHPQDILRDGVIRAADGAMLAVDLKAGERRRLANGLPVVIKTGSHQTVLAPVTPPTRGSAVYAANASPPSAPPVHEAVPIGSGTKPSPPPGRATYEGSYTDSTRLSAPSVDAPELHLMLVFEETWVLQGYERGELVSSITLTPQEEMTIEVFSWDRRRTSVDDTISSESESSSESQSLDRDSKEVLDELTKSGEFSWSVNAATQFKAGIFNVQAQTQAGVKLNAAQIAKTTQQSLREHSQKATERVKASRQTKVSESAEFGSETRTTRRLRNSNVCHAVSYNYFEVLRRYESTIACPFEEAGLILLVPNHLATEINFDINCVRHEELTLRKTLLDRGLSEGFEAARLLYMYEHVCETLCHTCTCPDDYPGGVGIERAEAMAALDALAQATVDLDELVTSLRWEDYFDAVLPIDPNPSVHPVRPLGGISVLEGWISAWVFVEAWQRLVPAAWRRLTSAARDILNVSGPAHDDALMALGDLARTIDQEKLGKALVPDDGMKAVLINEIKVYARKTYTPLAKAVTAPSTGAGVASIVIGFLTGDVVAIFGGILLAKGTEALTLESIVNTMASLVSERPGLAATDDGGIAASVTRAAAAYTAMRTAEASEAKVAESDAKAERVARKASVNSMFPPNRVLQARERFEALQSHLSRFGDYYRYHVLMDRRAAGLDLRPPVIAALGSGVNPTPMALIDGKLAYRVDLDVMPGSRELLDKLIARKDMPAPTEVEEFTLPTPGLVVEPKLSSCPACDDFVLEGRRIELELRRQQAAQAGLEVKRLRVRLEHEPPLLNKDEPIVPPLTVRVESADTSPR